MDGKRLKGEVDLKILVIGDFGVGKTTLLTNLCEYNGPTVEIMRKHITYKKKKYRLVLPDTLCAEQLGARTGIWFQKVTACIFMYDVTNQESLDNVENWVQELLRFGPNRGNIPKFLCGNKKDLETAVENDVVNNYCTKYNMKHFLISATTNDGVPELLNAVLPEAIKELSKGHAPAQKKSNGGGCVVV